MTNNQSVSFTVSIRTRRLHNSEKVLARKVFNNTLPLAKVRIVNKLGWDNRPFAYVDTEVTCDTYDAVKRFAIGRISPIVGLAYPLLGACDVESSNYYLCVGQDHYDSDMSVSKHARQLLIHELVHVWQGEAGLFPQAYMIQSLCDQATTDDAYAYEVKPDSLWTDFNIEQQANLVDEWFADGMKEDDSRFRFIKKTIRNQPPRDFDGVMTDVFENGF